MAQTFFSKPEYFFQPSSVGELQKIVTLARRLRKRICVTGYGHSPSDITCTSSWLINLDKLNRILDVQLSGLVRFEAGISLCDLNLIDVQSVAGSIATGTHGSSLSHGLLSSSVTSLTLLLANSQLITCTPDKNPDLFRAALVSLGSLGIIVEITMQVIPDFNIAWTQTLHPLSSIIANWSKDLWTQQEYTRVWWMPYSSRAVIWSASHTTGPLRPPNTTFYGGKFGYYLYHNLLYLAHYAPPILPWVEWLIFGMQYGFKPGNFSMSAVEPARNGLKMDCLYSQFVNEWALPLSKGPEAITRLGAWINGDTRTANIPFSAKNLYVHCPIEVRVSNAQPASDVLARANGGVTPYLSPLARDEPTLYLNATLYRPYGKDPPCWKRYYEAFEWLMRDLGGKPHWAKNFSWTTKEEIRTMYGREMDYWLRVRREVDPDGMFLGEWHVRNLCVLEEDKESAEPPRAERVLRTSKLGKGYGDAVLWEGQVEGGDDTSSLPRAQPKIEGLLQGRTIETGVAAVGTESENATPSPPNTSASQESFDYMAKGEASVWTPREGDGVDL
ncbi:putative D-arabinono-1,4-lactone oxidase [Cyphellophora attinorum]|uniref:D-arabinono-1,4-lactone oxidase n=1 Tax=Cyphellophora attinorum TaxID=1664694 RepID=A0A0N0NKK5_9EURO|nr:putative D-arabinono-1,4-lactone oxidase [Phialophora attinorum]KPI38251.1 putative D-arabinono-1,4-lactone oxidase [Phialophora attinorum]